MRISWTLGHLAIIAAASLGCTHAPEAVDPPRAEAQPSTSAPAAPRPADTCNGLDDDGDGVVDQAHACQAVCSKDAIAAAAAALRLPRPDDHTVPEGSATTPVLLEIQQVPDFCLGATPPSTPDEVTVACGEVLEVGRLGIAAKSVRVAPGGTVRFTDHARLEIREEILVCPGARLQSGAAIALAGDGHDGWNIDLHADRLLMLGTIETRGGWVPETSAAVPGKSGDLQIGVARLLFAGVIDTAEPAARGYRSGEPGYVGIFATEESFFSGKVRSGNAAMKVPVCCAK